MSYIILKYDIDLGNWKLHEYENEFTGKKKTALFKTEEEATKEAESLNCDYEIYEFVKDSMKR